MFARNSTSNKKHYSLASKVILKNFYVDDLFTGANLIKELKKLKHDIIKILSSAKFDINKWKSNAEINKNLDDSTATVKLGKTAKILSLWWNITTDMFHYQVTDMYRVQICFTVKLENKKEKIIKHNILSKIVGIYDPFG